MHHRLHFHLGRHSGGQGLGRFGKGFMDDGMGGRLFGMGRKLASVDLQLLILGLLAVKSHHGYAIIKALDERSKGFYVPSPGMVYPALTYLEEIGLGTIEAEGNRKRFHITEAGREHLAQHRARAESLFAQFDRVGERMERVRRAMGADSDVDPVADHGSDGSGIFRATRELKRAMAGKWDSPRDEQRRVAEILDRATADILGKEIRD